MPDTQLPAEIERPEPESLLTPPADASVERLCHLLIECERTQHRYQWASGVLLATLMNRSEAPKKLNAFVTWLADQTGMNLTQNEIRRRIDVYQFYSKFANARIIELIQMGGVQIAHRARRVLTHDQPEKAEAVLEACVRSPGRLDETLKEMTGEEPSHQMRRRTVRVTISAVNQIRLKLSTEARRIDGKEYVELPMVLELLTTLMD